MAACGDHEAIFKSGNLEAHELGDIRHKSKSATEVCEQKTIIYSYHFYTFTLIRSEIHNLNICSNQCPKYMLT